MASSPTNASVSQAAQEKPLFPCVYEWDNLLRAWDHVESNDGAPGVDRVTLTDFELRLDENLSALQHDLRDHLYQPQPLLRFLAPKPAGGLRPLVIATVRDRIAQTALAQIITPLVDRRFEPVSFGYRRGHSVAQAVAEVEKCYAAGYRWIVDADIDSFFEEVNHDVLMARLREKIHDTEILQLVSAWIKEPIQHKEALIQPGKGLPQGLPISPVLANLYLDDFDKAVVGRGLKLVRFADDFLILCKERPKAEAALALTASLLRGLRLKLDDDKTQVTSFDQGFRYLGHLFLRSLVLPSPNRDRHKVNSSHGSGACSLGPYSACPRSYSDTIDASHRSSNVLARALENALQAAALSGIPMPSLTAVHSPQAGSQVAATMAQPALAAAPADPAVAPSSGGTSESALAGISEAAKADGASSLALDVAGTSSVPPASMGFCQKLPPRPAAPLSPFRRTLYIQEQGSLLARQDERLLVKKDDEVLLDVPAAKVDQIFIFGRCAITTPAMTFCLERQIPIVLMSSRGQYYGVVDSPIGDHVTIHRMQFERAADRVFCLDTAKSIVRIKLANSRVLLQRHQRRKGVGAVAEAIQALEKLLPRVKQANAVEEVYGYEGQGAARYFEAFGYLLNFSMGFGHRVKHPPTDPVNSLLSFGYALSFYNIYAFTRARGLHPYVGYLHATRDWHPVWLLIFWRSSVLLSLTASCFIWSILRSSRKLISTEPKIVSIPAVASSGMKGGSCS